MTGVPRRTDRHHDSRAARQPGWVVLVGVLAVACLVIGTIMLAMLQAPGAHRGVIVTSCAFIAAGVLLVAIAWLGRGYRETHDDD